MTATARRPFVLGYYHCGQFVRVAHKRRFSDPHHAQEAADLISSRRLVVLDECTGQEWTP